MLFTQKLTERFSVDASMVQIFILAKKMKLTSEVKGHNMKSVGSWSMKNLVLTCKIFFDQEPLFFHISKSYRTYGVIDELRISVLLKALKIS